MDGQTEITNRTLGTLLRVNVKAWDLALPHAEFAFNKTPSNATGLSPFKVVYVLDPFSPLDLILRDMNEKPHMEASKRVEEIQKLYETVRTKIEEANASYKDHANKHRKKMVLHPGDLVWIHLRKERFPSKRKSKLMPRADGPFEVLERINDNAYKVNLPGDYGVSAAFNVADLSPYEEHDRLANLRANSLQQGEDDGGLSLIMIQGHQESSEGPSLMSKIQEISLGEQGNYFAQTEISAVHKPDFLHVIS